VTESHRDRLRSAVYTKLAENVIDVGRNGLATDDEPIGDLERADSFGQETQDFQLARSQPGDHGLRHWPRVSDQPRDSNEELVRRNRLGQKVIAADEQTGNPIV
jgi:hypothetical protein